MRGKMDTLSIITIIAFVLNILLAIAMVISEQKSVQSVLAWLSVLVFLPLVGFILYIMFGNGLGIRTRRMLKRTNMINIGNRKELEAIIKEHKYEFDEKTSKLMQKYDELITFNYNWANSVLTENNSIQFFADGSKQFEALKKDISLAKNHIHLDYYILAHDKFGKEIINLCTQKLKQGVSVKIIIDSLGSLKTRKRHFKKFINAGGEFREFFPPILPFKMLNFKMNYRNHRKIAIIDGKIGYVGGVNVRADHLGCDKKLTPWRDAHIRLEGLSVLALQSTFLSDWRFSTNDKKYPIKYLKKDYFPEPNLDGKCPVQIIASGPSNNKAEIKNALVKMINMAKKSIKIQTPYFVPDQVYLDSLKLAIASGIEVKLMIPKIPDKKLVYNASLSYVRELVELGAKVYLYKGFLHAKTMVIDDEICTIGTCNSDNRSFYLNFEINAFIYNEEFTQTVLKSIENDIKNSVEFKKGVTIPRFRRFKMALSRLFTPLL